MNWLYGLDKLHHVGSIRLRNDLLQSAIDFGASGFDVAPMYGSGFGESDLGRFLKESNIKREDIVVNTKFGISCHSYGAWAGSLFKPIRAIDLLKGKILPASENRLYSPRDLRISFDNSLRRLGVEYIDTLFIHEPFDRRDIGDELLKLLVNLKSRGLIRNIGVCGQLDCVFNISNCEEIDVVQAPLAQLRDHPICTKKRYAYHVRKEISNKSRSVGIDAYSQVSADVGADTFLFQTTKLEHLKQFVGGGHDSV